MRDQLIDDTEATNWQAAATQSGDGWTVDGRQVTVDLAGTRPQRIDARAGQRARSGRVYDPVGRVDLAPEPVHGAAPVRALVVQRAVRRLRDRATASTGSTRARRTPSRRDAPRPVAPTLLLREFTFSPVQATHLRLVVAQQPVHRRPDYQGEQDADPFNATDCNEAGPASTRFVRAAELQVFGQTVAGLQAG